MCHVRGYNILPMGVPQFLVRIGKMTTMYTRSEPRASEITGGVNRHRAWPTRLVTMIACCTTLPLTDGLPHTPAMDVMVPALCSVGLPAAVLFNFHSYAMVPIGLPCGVGKRATRAGSIKWSTTRRAHLTGCAGTAPFTLAGPLSLFKINRVATIAAWKPLHCPAPAYHDPTTTVRDRNALESWPCSLLHRCFRKFENQLGLQTCWRPVSRHAPTWGNWLILIFLACCSPDCRTGAPIGANEAESTPLFPDIVRLHPLLPDSGGWWATTSRGSPTGSTRPTRDGIGSGRTKHVGQVVWQ